jgi:hypothetical protein
MYFRKTFFAKRPRKPMKLSQWLTPVTEILYIELARPIATGECIDAED